MQWKIHWVKLLFYAVLLFMLFALALYAYLGTFTRYMADDYCSAAALKNEGFWGAQIYWWQTWSGRFSFTFLVSIVELFGLRIVPVLPALVLSLWIFSIAWVCIPLLKMARVSNYIPAALFTALVLLWSTYRSFEDYPQIVFWQTGILTYPISPILFLLGAGIAIRRSFRLEKVNWQEFFFWFWFAFLAGGFSETGAVVQIALLASLIVVSRMAKNGQRKILTPILLAAFCGSLFSLFVMALSPGNLIRPGGFQEIPALAQSLPGSLRETLLFLPRFIEQHTAVFVFGLLAGAFLGYFCIPDEVKSGTTSIAKYFGVSLVFTWMGIWAGIAPAYALRVGLPPERVLLFTHFLVTCAAFYWGILGAMLLRQNLPANTVTVQRWISFALLAVLLGGAVFPFVISQVEMALPLQEYSTVWDDRHQLLLQASGPVMVADLVEVDVLYQFKDRLWLVGDFDANPNYWINQCAAQYYGVEQIIAE